MQRPASTTSRFLRAALLIVLLAAQGLAAAHEFQHWGHPAQELCATCSLSSGLDGPVASAAPALQAPAPATFSFEYAEQHIRHDAPRPYFQRAPPHQL